MGKRKQKPTTLTDRQKLFVQEYLIDLNGKAAAIRAGYAARSAEVEASRLLRKAKVRALVDAFLATSAAKAGLRAEELLRDGVVALAYSNIKHYDIDDDGNVDLAKGAPANAMLAVSSIKRKVTTRTLKGGGEETDVYVELKLWDKPAAVRLGGSHLGLWEEKAADGTGRGTTIVVVDPYSQGPKK